MRSFVLLLALGVPAAALNLARRSAVEPVEQDRVGTLLPDHKITDAPVTQLLKSDEGMAYYGTLHVGGQPQQSIYDTGSFDLVVVSSCNSEEEETLKQGDAIQAERNPDPWADDEFSGLPAEIRDMFGFSRESLWRRHSRPHRHRHKNNKAAQAAAEAAAADEAKAKAKTEADDLLLAKAESTKCCRASKCPYSGYHKENSGVNFVDDGTDLERIAYGSGPCTIKGGHDHVEIKSDHPVVGDNVTVGEGNIPVKMIVDHNIQLFQVTNLQAIVGVGPGQFNDKENRMTSHLGLQRFTFCMNEDAHKDGKMIWNDKARDNDSEWLSVPSPAKQFWGVSSTGWSLSTAYGPFGLFKDNQAIGCDEGCGAIIDSGTSLLTPPTEVTNAIREQLENGNIADCSDLSKFPTLHFKLDGKDFSLPPQSYIADAGMSQGTVEINEIPEGMALPLLPMNKAEAEKAKLARQRGEKAAVHQCALLLGQGLEDQGTTQYGPMLIIGMPLFRKYAVQFDLSKDFEGEEARMMHFAEASPDCDGTLKGTRFKRQPGLQKVNLAKMRTSRIADGFKVLREKLKNKKMKLNKFII